MAKLASKKQVWEVSENIDGLHEKAGSPDLLIFTEIFIIAIVGNVETPFLGKPIYKQINMQHVGGTNSTRYRVVWGRI